MLNFLPPPIPFVYLKGDRGGEKIKFACFNLSIYPDICLE